MRDRTDLPQSPPTPTAALNAPTCECGQPRTSGHTCSRKATGGGPETNWARVINAPRIVVGELPADPRSRRLVQNVWGTDMADKTTAWPVGVIGRYITVGGGNVDLTAQDTSVLAKCNACPKEWTSYDDPTCDDLPNRSRSTERAGDWAQTHAEKCRAMPKPDGA